MNRLNTLTWWLWWTNPLVKVHPDQRHHFTSEVQFADRTPSYKDISQLRSTLELSLIPEEGIHSAPFLGFFALADSKDISLFKTDMAAITFGPDIVKLRSDEWKNYFGIDDKERIRNLIGFNKKVPNEIAPLVQAIVEECGDWAAPDRLDVTERLLIIAGLFFKHRYPKFTSRWVLGMSYRVIGAVDKLSATDPAILDIYCDFLADEIASIAAAIKSDYEISENSFGPMPEEELANNSSH